MMLGVMMTRVKLSGGRMWRREKRLHPHFASPKGAQCGTRRSGEPGEGGRVGVLVMRCIRR